MLEDGLASSPRVWVIPLGSSSLVLLLGRSHVHCHKPVLHELDLYWDEEWAFIWLQE